MRRLRGVALALGLASLLAIRGSVIAHGHGGGLETATCAACAVAQHHPVVVDSAVNVARMEWTGRPSRRAEPMRGLRPVSANRDGRAPPAAAIVSPSAVA